MGGMGWDIRWDGMDGDESSLRFAPLRREIV